MTGALVILAALIVIGLMLFLTDKAYFQHGHSHKKSEIGSNSSQEKIENTEQQSETHGEFCCGQHLVCEKTGLSPTGNDILYYDDEELDRFIGRDQHSYTFEEIEEFRDILLTLLPGDVAGWARSITLRKIELPEEIREELLMIVSDLRSNQQI